MLYFHTFFLIYLLFCTSFFVCVFNLITFYLVLGVLIFFACFAYHLFFLQISGTCTALARRHVIPYSICIMAVILFWSQHVVMAKVGESYRMPGVMRIIENMTGKFYIQNCTILSGVAPPKLIVITGWTAHFLIA